MKPPSALSECLDETEIGILVAAYGAGQRLFVPRSTANAAHFEILIGIAATSRLIEALFGSYVYLPGLPRPTGHARQPSLVAVKALTDANQSASTIARRFRVSVRCIYGKRAEIRRRERLGIALDAKCPRKSPTPKKGRETRRRRPSLRRSVTRELTDQ